MRLLMLLVMQLRMLLLRSAPLLMLLSTKLGLRRRSLPLVQLRLWNTWSLPLVLLLLLLRMMLSMLRSTQRRLRMVLYAPPLLRLSVKRKPVGTGVGNREAAIGVAGGVAHRDEASGVAG